MIRSLGVGNVADMANLHANSFETAWPEDEMRGHIENDLTLGIGEPLVGFMIIRVVSEQADLLTIAVNPARRREGLATQLLQAGEAAAKAEKAGILFLDVAEDNPSAIAFYRKHDYEEFARRPGYYKRSFGRVGALLFRKRL